MIDSFIKYFHSCPEWSDRWTGPEPITRPSGSPPVADVPVTPRSRTRPLSCNSLPVPSTKNVFKMKVGQWSRWYRQYCRPVGNRVDKIGFCRTGSSYLDTRHSIPHHPSRAPAPLPAICATARAYQYPLRPARSTSGSSVQNNKHIGCLAELIHNSTLRNLRICILGFVHQLQIFIGKLK